MSKWSAALVLMFFSAASAMAEIKTQTVEYNDGKTVLEGYLAYDDAVKGSRPGILVVHEWSGLGDFVKHRAELLAKMGYVAFAADIYGKGVRPVKLDDCMATSSLYYKDRNLFRSRVSAGLEQLKLMGLVDPHKLAAIGYCFGGAGVLELARSGADIKGVVTFHGNLETPKPEDAKNIKCQVLVCQGGADNFTLSQVPAFKKEMKDARVDYKIITYPGAQHSFTNPEAKGQLKGALYNAKADKESWNAMKGFFKKIFKP